MYIQGHTLRVASCTFGFLWPTRRFSERMASLGCTVLDRIMSDISRLSGISSLRSVSAGWHSYEMYKAYKLEEVARSSCSSKALLVEDPNQPAMVSVGIMLCLLGWCGIWCSLQLLGIVIELPGCDRGRPAECKVAC